MKKNSKIYVAGGQSGLVGKALVKLLKENKYSNIIVKTRKELDLLNQKKVEAFFKNEKPEYVFLAAAKVGGILVNKTQKADFLYENLAIQNNVIYSAWKYKVKKLLFLGSSCIYPRLAPQPMKEEYLLTGKPEETNDAYAIAKIAGVMLCQNFNKQYKTNFISLVPTNLYGPNDNFDYKTSHVVPVLIRKFHEATINKKGNVVVWGSGKAYREFLYVHDLADACLYLMKNYDSSEIVNVGTGEDITIKNLAKLIKKIVGFNGEIKWDRSKPDGAPRKKLDVTKLNKLGWKSKTTLPEGIKNTYKWCLENKVF